MDIFSLHHQELDSITETHFQDGAAYIQNEPAYSNKVLLKYANQNCIYPILPDRIHLIHVY